MDQSNLWKKNLLKFYFCMASRSDQSQNCGKQIRLWARQWLFKLTFMLLVKSYQCIFSCYELRLSTPYYHYGQLYSSDVMSCVSISHLPWYILFRLLKSSLFFITWMLKIWNLGPVWVPGCMPIFPNNFFLAKIQGFLIANVSTMFILFFNLKYWV